MSSFCAVGNLCRVERVEIPPGKLPVHPVAKRATAGGDAAVASLVNKSASALVGSDRLASKARDRSIKRTVPRR